MLNDGSPDDRSVIRIAAAVVVDESGRTLLVRKRGTDIFMLPGGKIAAGESPLEAMAREVGEELGCAIDGEARALGSFTAAAANEPGATVEAILFGVALDGVAKPAAEIEEAVWHDPADAGRRLAPLARDHVVPLILSWRVRQ